MWLNGMTRVHPWPTCLYIQSKYRYLAHSKSGLHSHHPITMATLQRGSNLWCTQKKLHTVLLMIRLQTHTCTCAHPRWLNVKTLVFVFAFLWGGDATFTSQDRRVNLSKSLVSALLIPTFTSCEGRALKNTNKVHISGHIWTGISNTKVHESAGIVLPDLFTVWTGQRDTVGMKRF